MKIKLIFLIFYCFLFQNGYAGQNFFKKHTLSSGGIILNLLSLDINDDKFKDIIAISRKNEYPNWKLSLDIFLFKKDQVKQNADFSVTNLENVIFMDDGFYKGVECLFLLTTTQVKIIYIDKGKLIEEAILTINTGLKQAEFGNITILDFQRENLLIVPDLNNFQIYSVSDKINGNGGNGGAVILLNTIQDTPNKSFYKSNFPEQPSTQDYYFRNTNWIPYFIMRDFDGDDVNDILFTWDDELWIFKLDKNFNVKEKSYIYLNMLKEKERLKKDTYLSSQLEDIDNDKLPDLVLNKISGGIMNQKLNVYIYWGKNIKNKIGENLLNMDNASSIGTLFDLDNDKKFELILTKFNSGILSIVKALLSKKITLNFQFFCLHHNRFNKSSDYSIDLELKVDLDSLKPDGFLPQLKGDFNGDGLTDAIYGEDKESINIHFQKNNRFYEDEDLNQNLRNSENLLIEDFNQDKKSDFAFIFPKDEKLNREIHLYTNEYTNPPK